MKNCFIQIFALSICLSILCACNKDALPVPDYPLDAATVEEAVQQWGLSCIIQEDEQIRDMRPEQTLYVLYSVENTNFMIAGISSGQQDGERALFISFAPFYSYTAIPAEECESAIVFATRLFGGFRSSHQVYDRFMREYGKVNTERVQYESSRISSIPTREGSSYWESNFDGMICKIELAQPSLKEPQEYLSGITIISDWNTFYPG